MVSGATYNSSKLYSEVPDYNIFSPLPNQCLIFFKCRETQSIQGNNKDLLTEMNPRLDVSPSFLEDFKHLLHFEYGFWILKYGMIVHGISCYLFKAAAGNPDVSQLVGMANSGNELFNSHYGGTGGLFMAHATSSDTHCFSYDGQAVVACIEIVGHDIGQHDAIGMPLG